jgi:hypothetical protein
MTQAVVSTQVPHFGPTLILALCGEKPSPHEGLVQIQIDMFAISAKTVGPVPLMQPFFFLKELKSKFKFENSKLMCMYPNDTHQFTQSPNQNFVG